MDKIIGKKWALIFLCITPAVLADISMRVLDQDGAVISRAAVGHPFTIEVQVSNVTQFGAHPTIGGLDQLVAEGRAQIQKTGTHISMVNGNTVATYSYDVIINEPNTYTIGPAIFSDRTKKLNSKIMHLEVGDQVESQKSSSSSKDSSVFMRLTVDKPSVFVGERIPCRLRFYFTDNRIALKQLLLQESKHVSKKQWRGPYTGTERIDGVEYNFAEWLWDLYADASGNLAIPAYGADYEKQVARNARNDFWGGLGRFFGDRFEIKRVYSNAASVHAQPLPAHDQEVQGVGTFSYIHMSAQPSVAKQGEGIVVTVEIAGDSDMDVVNIHSLKGVPETLKYYDSKQTIIEPHDIGDVYKKRFEFVVQGLKSGSWEIPAQSFHYFDVNRREYRTLQSAPLTLTILPGVVPGAVPPIVPSHASDQEQASIASLHKDGPWAPVSRGLLFAWWFIGLLLIMPLVVLIMSGLWIRYKGRVKVPYARLRSQYAFKQAQKRFQKITAEKDVRKLYALFVELIADRSLTSFGMITAPFIVMQFKEKNLSAEEIENWNRFFGIITERAYGAHADKTDEQLLREAEIWLNKLQNIL